MLANVFKCNIFIHRLKQIIILRFHRSCLFYPNVWLYPSPVSVHELPELFYSGVINQVVLGCYLLWPVYLYERESSHPVYIVPERVAFYHVNAIPLLLKFFAPGDYLFYFLLGYHDMTRLTFGRIVYIFFIVPDRYKNNICIMALGDKMDFKRTIKCSNCGNETNVYLNSELDLNELLLAGRCSRCGNSLQLTFNIVDKSSSTQGAAVSEQPATAVNLDESLFTPEIPSNTIKDLMEE